MKCAETTPLWSREVLHSLQTQEGVAQLGPTKGPSRVALRCYTLGICVKHWSVHWKWELTSANKQDILMFTLGEYQKWKDLRTTEPWEYTIKSLQNWDTKASIVRSISRISHELKPVCHVFVEWYFPKIGNPKDVYFLWFSHVFSSVALDSCKMSCGMVTMYFPFVQVLADMPQFLWDLVREDRCEHSWALFLANKTPQNISRLQW